MDMENTAVVVGEGLNLNQPEKVLANDNDSTDSVVFELSAEEKQRREEELAREDLAHKQNEEV